MNLRKLMSKINDKGFSLSFIWQYLYTHSKEIAFMSCIFAFGSGIAWKTYAEEKVNSQIKQQLAPIVVEIADIKMALVTIKDEQKSIKFDTKQLLYIQYKTLDKNIIDELKRETDTFKPQN